MKFTSKRAPYIVGAAAALLLTFSTAAVYPALAQTSDPTPTPGAATPSTQESDKGADESTGESTGRGFGKGAGRIDGNSDELVAEALGITVDELNAAYLQAANAALDQAVTDDLLTQTQADNLRGRLESAGSNGFHLGGRGLHLFGSDSIDGEALLADALGVTADELQAAYDEAETAALAQAVTDGQLTQEQADLLSARRALHAYWATQQQTYEENVQAALDAGAITQTQADLLLANAASMGGPGFGLGGDFGHGMGAGHRDGGHRDGGRGMRGMDGGRGDFLPAQPDDSSDVQSNSGLVLPSAGL